MPMQCRLTDRYPDVCNGNPVTYAVIGKFSNGEYQRVACCSECHRAHTIAQVDEIRKAVKLQRSRRWRA